MKSIRSKAGRLERYERLVSYTIMGSSTKVWSGRLGPSEIKVSSRHELSGAITEPLTAFRHCTVL